MGCFLGPENGTPSRNLKKARGARELHKPSGPPSTRHPHLPSTQGREEGNPDPSELCYRRRLRLRGTARRLMRTHFINKQNGWARKRSSPPRVNRRSVPGGTVASGKQQFFPRANSDCRRSDSYVATLEAAGADEDSVSCLTRPTRGRGERLIGAMSTCDNGETSGLAGKRAMIYNNSARRVHAARSGIDKVPKASGRYAAVSKRRARRRTCKEEDWHLHTKAHKVLLHTEEQSSARSR